MIPNDARLADGSSRIARAKAALKRKKTVCLSNMG
jgi:hypothetical protein